MIATPANPIRRPQSAPARASACPGLLRIVDALDGGICRIKLTAGRIDAQQALAIADAAERYGSGVIEMTNRANLQIRGVRVGHAQTLIDCLLSAGLGPSVPGGDDVRNIMASPTLGVDREALCDVEPLVIQLLDLLQRRFAALSPKFALLLDGGERVAVLEHAHDIWLAALPAAPGDEQLLAFGLAGCPPQPNAKNAAPLAAVPLRHAFELVAETLQLFVELAAARHARMRQLLAEVPATEFLKRLQQRLTFPLIINSAIVNWRRQPAPPYEYLGIHAQRQRDRVYIGAMPVLGRIDAMQLRALANLVIEHSTAENDGVNRLRFTPWQSVLLANISAADGSEVLQHLQHLGFSGDADAALTRALACSGSTGCAKGLADTKADAVAIAAYLQENLPHAVARPAIHLSGCARSCAAASVAPFTLLAVAPGHYDVFQRAEGYMGFGKLLAAHCSSESAAVLLAEWAIENHAISSQPEFKQ